MKSASVSEQSWLVNPFERARERELSQTIKVFIPGIGLKVYDFILHISNPLIHLINIPRQMYRISLRETYWK